MALAIALGLPIMPVLYWAYCEWKDEKERTKMKLKEK